MKNDSMISVHAKAAEAEQRLNDLGRDLRVSDHKRCDLAFARAYSTPPISPAGFAELADLVLKVEMCDPHIQRALESIREGAWRLARA